MKLPVVVRPEARDDIVSTQDWYEQRRPGLGDQFLDALADVLARISLLPEGHDPVVANVRRTKLNGFPFVVYYRTLADRVEVLAVLHGRRHPSTWRKPKS